MGTKIIRILMVLVVLQMYQLRCMEDVQSNFSQAITLYLKAADLHFLCQMVGCLTVCDRKENDELDADDAYEMIRTLNMSGRNLNDQIPINSKGMRGYAKNLIKLAVIQRSDINFLSQLGHRAPLFKIKKLILDNNELTQLPAELVQFPHLQVFSAKNNQFKQFPSVLYAINTLDEIDMSHNQITTINPQAIASMNNLKILILHHNNVPNDDQQEIEQLWIGKDKNALALKFGE